MKENFEKQDFFYQTGLEGFRLPAQASFRLIFLSSDRLIQPLWSRASVVVIMIFSTASLPLIQSLYTSGHILLFDSALSLHSNHMLYVAYCLFFGTPVRAPVSAYCRNHSVSGCLLDVCDFCTLLHLSTFSKDVSYSMTFSLLTGEL